MCGIVGYVGKKEASPLLIEGLRRLEYRGYDSAGVCILADGALQVRKQVGRVEGLAQSLKAKPVHGSLGISHTRWATHGLPSDINSHPHLDQSGKIAMVHNGIIENYAALRHRLQRHGHHFLSQTDTEVLSHLIGYHLDKLLARNGGATPERVTQAIFAATREVEGTYGIALMHQDLPGYLFGARRGSPLVVGIGKGENFLASDVSPIVAHTRKVIYLHDGDVVTLTDKDFALQAKGKPIKRPVSSVDWSAEEAERGKYPHYMLKEIFEQPGRVAEVLRRTLRPAQGNIEFEELALKPKELAKIKRLILVACGTSWHAALVGEYVIEDTRPPAGRGRIRQRNALPQPPHREEHARGLHLPIRRDRRHAGRPSAAPRPRAPARWPSSTSSAPPSPASPTRTSTCTPARRSAWPRPRPSRCRCCN